MQIETGIENKVEHWLATKNVHLHSDEQAQPLIDLLEIAEQNERGRDDMYLCAMRIQGGTRDINKKTRAWQLIYLILSSKPCAQNELHFVVACAEFITKNQQDSVLRGITAEIVRIERSARHGDCYTCPVYFEDQQFLRIAYSSTTTVDEAKTKISLLYAELPWLGFSLYYGTADRAVLLNGQDLLYAVISTHQMINDRKLLIRRSAIIGDLRFAGRRSVHLSYVQRLIHYINGFHCCLDSFIAGRLCALQLRIAFGSQSSPQRMTDAIMSMIPSLTRSRLSVSQWTAVVQMQLDELDENMSKTEAMIQFLQVIDKTEYGNCILIDAKHKEGIPRKPAGLDVLLAISTMHVHVLEKQGYRFINSTELKDCYVPCEEGNCLVLRGKTAGRHFEQRFVTDQSKDFCLAYQLHREAQTAAAPSTSDRQAGETESELSVNNLQAIPSPEHTMNSSLATESQDLTEERSNSAFSLLSNGNEDCDVLNSSVKLKRGSYFMKKYLIMDSCSPWTSNMVIAMNIYLGQHVILKFNADETSVQNFKQFLKTIDKSDHICRPIEIIEDQPGYCPCLVYEAGDITLEQWLQQEPRPTFNQINTVLRQVIQGIGELHAEEIVHGNLKPGGIVHIARDSRWKLADIDKARFIGQRMPIDYTLQYACPEMVNAEQKEQSTIKVGKAMDMFSFGVIVYESITGRRMYDEEQYTCDEDIINCLCQRIPLPDVGLVEQRVLRSVIEKIFCWDPAQRATAREIMQEMASIQNSRPSDLDSCRMSVTRCSSSQSSAHHDDPRLTAEHNIELIVSVERFRSYSCSTDTFFAREGKEAPTTSDNGLRDKTIFVLKAGKQHRLRCQLLNTHGQPLRQMNVIRVRLTTPDPVSADLVYVQETNNANTLELAALLDPFKIDAHCLMRPSPAHGDATRRFVKLTIAVTFAIEDDDAYEETVKTEIYCQIIRRVNEHLNVSRLQLQRETDSDK